MWAAMRAILMFHNCEGQSHKTVSTDHNFWRERRAEADSNRGPSAYQPNALPGYAKPAHTWWPSKFWAVQWSWFARVNALCNLSQEVARGRTSLPGWFLNWRCFSLCITMEVETRIAKQYKCHYCCSCKNYRVKVMKGGVKKCLCVVFWLTRRSRLHGENAFWGIL